MDDNREKILQGLVEHDGRWIPIAEKLKIVREAGMAKVSVSIETAVHNGTVADPTLDKAPLSSVEKAAFSKFADAMSKDDPQNWHLPGSRINIEEVKRDFKEPAADTLGQTGAITRAISQSPAPVDAPEDNYLEYLRAQRRRTLYLFVGVAVAVLVAGAAVVLVVLNG